MISSLGFRGEALSSIAAVSRVELITKPHEQLIGVRYQIEGGMEKGMEEIGAPDGTTFLIRDLFYNTPARAKFLKTPTTEAGYISSFIEQLALSHPHISFKYMQNGQTKLHTSGNNNLKEAIYQIYGRDITREMIDRNQVVTESSTEGIRQEVGERLERDRSRELVLIVDDAEINREILFEMLKDRFDIIEASSGEECLELLHQYGTEISIVLLDFIMSGIDGLGVLNVMNKEHLIEDIPVIMISSEDSALHIRQAYEMGVSDYISRPFDTNVVRQRVYNTIKLYAKQRKLIDLVAGQMQEKEKNNQIMVNILSHIVECRNGESGQHVRNIGILTKLLLKKLMQKTDRYQMTWGDLNRIALASALHDIGKIGIEEAILNKPGKLMQEEYEKMKKHTVIGWSMLQNLKQYQEEPLVRIAEQICRWHHERYDGKGYPDGLKGDEIPISAQVVSLADVYDALTNERVYKKAIPHEKAIEMIVTGECGQFNPMLIECLLEIKEDIPIQLMNAEYRNSWTPLDVWGGNALMTSLKTEG